MILSTGAAETAFTAVCAAWAVRLRALVMCCCALLGVAAPPAGYPVATGAAVLAVVWSGVHAAAARRAPSSRPLAVADLGVLCALCLSQGAVPPASSAWVPVAVGVAVAGAQLTPSRASGAVLAAVTAGAGAAGVLLGRPDAGWPAVAQAGWLLVQALAAGVLYETVLRRCRERDAAEAAAGEERLRREVAEARHRAERRFLAMLHDTSCATLLLASAPGPGVDPRDLRAQAVRDLARLGAAPDGSAAGAGGEAGETGERTGSGAAGDVRGTDELTPDPGTPLAAALAAELRGPRLRVTSALDPGLGSVPSPAAQALCGAVGEALRNTARHAGVSTARLRAVRDGSGVTVTVTDDGIGFDPDRVPAGRRGLSHSVTERMTLAGGTAHVSSRSGRGTEIRLHYAPPEDGPDETPGPPVRPRRADTAGGGQGTADNAGRRKETADAPRRSPRHGKPVARPAGQRAAGGGETTAPAGRGPARGTRAPGAGRRPHPTGSGVIAALCLGLALPVLLHHLPPHPAPGPEPLLLALLLATWLPALLTRTGPGRAGAAAPAPALFLTAAVLLPLSGGGHPADGAFGALLTAGWPALLLLPDRGRPALLCGAVAHLAHAGAQLWPAGVPDHRPVAGLVLGALALLALQLGCAALGLLLRDHLAATRDGAARRWCAHRRALISAQLRTDRLARRAALSRTTVPLLAALADGRLDTADPDVRHRCAVEAARLRRLFAESDNATDPLVHELMACAEVAERRGASVTWAVRGAPVPLPGPVRRALTEPALIALALTRRTARVTVVRDPLEVRVAVVTDHTGEPPAVPPLPDGTAGHRTGVTVLAGDGRLWLEAVCPVHSSSSETSPS
ncbi:sensor histidine kinase [Streptomyces carpaticus]|uniref:Sensor histidine kinase n=1 Tax=Streptomyces carpaticus TaxID=285558 RepID=A0ABV4ZN61_9ACTN